MSGSQYATAELATGLGAPCRCESGALTIPNLTVLDQPLEQQVAITNDAK